MEYTFEKMPPTSRVWVYQAEKPLNDNEVNKIEENAKTFLAEWAAHGAPLKGACRVFHHRFVVIAVDESVNQASGCSIDSSVHFVQALEQELGISLFDRVNVAYMQGGAVSTTPLQGIKNAIAEGVIDKDTPIFNNLVANKADLGEKWPERAENTWLKRYFQ